LLVFLVFFFVRWISNRIYLTNYRYKDSCFGGITSNSQCLHPTHSELEKLRKIIKGSNYYIIHSISRLVIYNVMTWIHTAIIYLIRYNHDIKKEPIYRINICKFFYVCLFIYLNCNDFDSTEDEVETFVNTFYYCLSTFIL